MLAHSYVIEKFCNFALNSHRCDVIVNQERPKATKQEIINKVYGVDAIFWRSKELLDKEVLNAAGTFFVDQPILFLNSLTCKFSHQDLN